MNPPRRWKESSDAPVGVRDLLAAGRKPRALDDGAFRRGQERVAAMTLAPAAAAAIASVWTKLAAAGAVVVATAGTVVAIDAMHREPPPAPSRLEVPTRVAPPPVARTIPDPDPEPPPVVVARTPIAKLPPPPAVVVAAPPSVTAHPEPAADEPPKRESTLDEELALLDEARGRLASDPTSALDRLAAHRARFAAGVLATERDLMELDALRRAGRVQDARDRARAWLAREPKGIHAARLREFAAGE